MTFDAYMGVYIQTVSGWKNKYEVFCRCRRCCRTTIFCLSQKSIEMESIFRDGFPFDTKIALNNIVDIDGFISLKDRAAEVPPAHVPDVIEKVFREAATCTAVGCWNAAGSMFRATVDLATRPLLPSEEAPESPPRKVRRDLGLRLPWLFENRLLPDDLRELSTCIREDGNDGAHQGTLGKADAEDLRDFTRALLERLFTQPARLREAERRRAERRSAQPE